MRRLYWVERLDGGRWVRVPRSSHHNYLYSLGWFDCLKGDTSTAYRLVRSSRLDGPTETMESTIQQEQA